MNVGTGKIKCNPKVINNCRSNIEKENILQKIRKINLFQPKPDVTSSEDINIQELIEIFY